MLENNKIPRAAHTEQWQDMISRLYPELSSQESNDLKDRKLSRTVTFQVTDACNLACTYCYQINKGHRVLKKEDAFKLIDMMLIDDSKLGNYINIEKSPGIILEFIGGEPFLEIELIDQICDYFFNKAIDLNHPWAEKFCISICSNGVLGLTDPVKHFLDKWRNHLSYSVTIDGNKELHDACRIFPDGRPSYDIAVKAAKWWMDRGGKMGSKITIAPGNIEHLKDAIVHMVELGYDDINANCVYEEGWTTDHAKTYYSQLKSIADYWIDNEIVETHALSLFEETSFKPKDPGDDENWCGGTGLMLSIDPDGNLYPCIRYMESSLGNTRDPLYIGNVQDGIGQCDICRKRISMLENIDRRSQSTDECYNCPIAEGCSWCSAYNYQVTGTPDKRVTYICIMHKARSLANVYFWNRWYRGCNMDKRFQLNCPDDWALEIISSDELNYLKELAND